MWCRAWTSLANLQCTGISGVWKNAGKDLEGRTYQARWPVTWKEKLKEKVDKTYCCVTELMQHAIDEGNRLFADTPYKDTWYTYVVCMLPFSLACWHLHTTHIQVDLPWRSITMVVPRSSVLPCGKRVQGQAVPKSRKYQLWQSIQIQIGRGHSRVYAVD